LHTFEGTLEAGWKRVLSGRPKVACLIVEPYPMSAVLIISASLLHQKDSALTKWFRSRTENARATRKAIRLDDILIIAAYNAQVFEIQERIPNGRVGTVDKFQGQEAPIVIYSITTSSHFDAPRIRLESTECCNFTTMALCVLVGSSR
jgi:hypothetical protein